MKSAYRLLPVLAIVMLVLPLFSQLSQAQAAVEFSDPAAEYLFGDELVFRVRVASDIPLQEVVVLFKSLGDSQTLLGTADIGEDGQAEYVHDLSSQPLRVFSKVEYRFQVQLTDGTSYTSPDYYFQYEDNRFDWQVLSSLPFSVHWYDGDLAFAQSVLDVAHQGLQRAAGYLPVQSPAEVNIYVYTSAADLQATLRMAKWDWVAGHADPDLGLMVVSLSKGPERRMETERQVPHELMHILLFEKLGPGYQNLPAWLNEGLASINETYPIPEYTVLLEHAIKDGTLLPISSLCHAFSPDASTITLSYAESQSFTRYLYRHYGAPQLDQLVTLFADGLDCELGFKKVFGIALNEMEQAWLADMFPNVEKPTTAVQVSELWPWFSLIGIVVALPLGAGLSIAWKGRVNRSSQ